MTNKKEIDLNQFIAWQREGKDRTVNIEIGDVGRSKDITIWVYDYELMAGQHVTSVDEIDLEKAHEEEERRKYERLKKKFEVDKDDTKSTSIK